MDFQSQLYLWIFILIAVVVLGGPILMILGMMLAWLMPAIIFGGICLLVIMAIGHSMDKESKP